MSYVYFIYEGILEGDIIDKGRFEMGYNSASYLTDKEENIDETLFKLQKIIKYGYIIYYSDNYNAYVITKNTILHIRFRDILIEGKGELGEYKMNKDRVTKLHSKIIKKILEIEEFIKNESKRN